MKGHIIFTILFLSATFAVQAQNYPALLSPNSYPCPNDSSQILAGFNGWEVYQTTNNEPDGPRDTSSCINLYDAAGYNNALVLLNEINPNLDLFIRATGINTALQSDQVYSYYGVYVSEAAGLINMMDTCGYGTCSGLFTGILVPDSVPGTFTYRWYENGFSESLCFPTERNDNWLDDVYFRFSFTDTTLQNDSIIIRPPYLEYPYYTTRVYDQSDLSFYRNGNNIDLNYSRYLIMHNNIYYPSANNVSYVEFSPQPNTSSPTPITITINPYSDLVFQPYSAIRGSYALTDTVNRHPVNIVNNGGNMCMPLIFEKYFEKGAYYEHRNGLANFVGKRSCFFFGNGGTLKVANGATMHYGYNGRGMMALATGGTIEIGNDAELIMSGGITLMEYDWETTPQQIYMELNTGSKLTFAPGSHIDNKRSKDGSMKLNIYMNGGTVDMSGLPEDQRKLINLIYPEATGKLADNIQIGPNPFMDELSITLIANHEKLCTYSVYDLQGNLLLEEEQSIRKGVNHNQIDLNTLPGGQYILQVTTGGESYTRQLIKLD